MEAAEEMSLGYCMIAVGKGGLRETRVRCELLAEGLSPIYRSVVPEKNHVLNANARGPAGIKNSI